VSVRATVTVASVTSVVVATVDDDDGSTVTTVAVVLLVPFGFESGDDADNCDSDCE